MRRAGIHPQFENAVPILTYDFYSEQIRAYYLPLESKSYHIYIVWNVEGHIVRFAQLMQINEEVGGVITNFIADYIPHIQAMLVSLFDADIRKNMNMVSIWTDIGNSWMPSYQNMAVDRWENKQLEAFSDNYGASELDALAWFMGFDMGEDDSVGTIPEKEDKPSITVDPLDLPPTEPDKWDNALGDDDNE
jgi:hypothetical protein